MNHRNLLGALALAGAQDKPTEIPKKDLPKSAVCANCVGLGTMMTEAKVTHGFIYREKPYYFHSKELRDGWARDPIASLPPVLPRPMDELEFKDSSGKVWNTASFKGRLSSLTPGPPSASPARR